MAQYKSIVTITWKFTSEDSFQDCLIFTKEQVDQILQIPQGEKFEGFGIQVNLARMKDKKKVTHLGEFSLEEVLPYITGGDEKRVYMVNGKEYFVKMNSERYFVFKNNNKCVSCGLEGTKMILDINSGDQSPHFNLYAKEHGRLVLMTKDHVIAKSQGGLDDLSNYSTMCSICNNLKGDYTLNNEEVRKLRELHKNEGKLPKKELKELINKTRKEMAERNK